MPNWWAGTERSRWRRRRSRCATRTGLAVLSYPDNWVPRFADAYRRQLADWIGAVETGIPVGASAWDGYVASAIAEQIAAALAEAREATLKYAPRPPLYD